MSYTFKPQAYIFYGKVDPASQTVNAIYRINTVRSLQASLSTTAIGQATLTISETDGLLLADPRTAPSFMDLLQIQLVNRYNQRLVAWTGVISKVFAFDQVGQDRYTQIEAYSPLMYFERRTQLPQEVLSFAQAYLAGVKLSDVVTFACNRARVNYPGPLAAFGSRCGGYDASLQIDPGIVDATWSFGGIDMGNITNPTLSSWMAVIQGVVGDTATECFPDEAGSLIIRPLAYLKPTPAPKQILPEDIDSVSVGINEEGVYTQADVRYSPQANQYATQAVWSAPQGMQQVLGTRTYATYQPWIESNAAAQYVANGIGDMTAADILQGSVSIVPDPSYKVGRLVQLATPYSRGTTVFYVTDIAYDLEVGGDFSQQLTLKYGRSQASGFPLLGTLPYVVASQAVLASLPQGTISSTAPATSPTNPAQIAHSFTLSLNRSLKGNQVSMDPSIEAPGTVVQIRSPGKSGKTLGEYTVVAGTQGQGYALGLPNTMGQSTGIVTIVDVSNAQTPSTSGTSSATPTAPGTTPTPQQPATPPTPPTGASLPTPTGFAACPLKSGATVVQHFGFTGNPSEPIIVNGQNFHTGIDISDTGGTGAGSPVHAVFTGVVEGVVDSWTHVWVDGIDFAEFGQTVVIRAGNWLVHYSHMVPGSPTVKTGMLVQAGAVIGTEGDSGNSSGTHLHLGLWDFGASAPAQIEQGPGWWIDPTSYVRRCGCQYDYGY